MNAEADRTSAFRSTNRPPRHASSADFALALALAALALTAPPARAQAEGEDDPRTSYSFVRTLEGRATLASVGQGPGEEADLHQILQSGDRLRIERGARVEIALADRNLLRVGGGSDLTLARVAFSADRDDRSTRLELERGELVIEVTDNALGDELPEIRTLTARIYLNEPGLYRVRTESDGYTELVVRRGYAELVTDRGSTIVRSGEEAFSTGDRWRAVELATAGPRDALERWADELDQRAVVARDRVLHVEPELAYAAAPLADHGSWVYVDTSWYWRPRVASGWRPYHHGRWGWSPSGLTWISSEPWGWVPYHYGSWCQRPGYGWIWRPGPVYSPAWVYWYVSDSWTGWCPTGYYTQHYGGYGHSGFRWGVYGWTGGSWGLYANWNFAPTRRVCDRRVPGGWLSGDAIGRTHGPTTPHGVLTTDTSLLPRDRWDRPDELVRVLERGPRGGRPRELPVVTDFVARKTDLTPNVEAAIRPDPSERSARRRGTPFAPDVETGRETRVGGRNDRPDPGWRSRRDQAPGLRTEDRSGRRNDDVATRSNERRTDGGDPAIGIDRGAVERREGKGRQPVDVDATSRGQGQGRGIATGEVDAGNRQGWRGRDRSAENGSNGSPGSIQGSEQGHRRDRGEPAAPARRGERTESSTDDSNGRNPRDPVWIDPNGRNRSQRPAPPVDSGAGANEGRGRVEPNDTRNDSASSGRAPRYGYPAREIQGDSPQPPAATEPRDRGRGQSGSSYSGGSSEPVQRVIGGVRRATPESAPPTVHPGTRWSERSRPSGGSSTPPPTSSGSRVAPRTPRTGGSSSGTTAAPPPSGSRGANPGQGASSGSGRGQRPQERSSPPPDRSRASSSSSSSASSSSKSSSSSSSSSPPPKKQRPRGDGN